MALPSFKQWMAEDGRRTAMGIYPPLYGSGQYPPLDNATKSPSHLNQYATIHGDEHPELLSKEIRDEFKKNKKKAKKKN